MVLTEYKNITVIGNEYDKATSSRVSYNKIRIFLFYTVDDGKEQKTYKSIS